MVAASDIVDSGMLEIWLEDRSLEDAICIAHRAAMRVAPFAWNQNRHLVAPEKSFFLTPLLTIRPLVISGVARSFQSSDVMLAARSASYAITSIAADAPAPLAASTTAFCVAVAVKPAEFGVCFQQSSVAGAGFVPDSAFWQSVKSDCFTLEQDEDPFSQPLWIGPEVEHVGRAWVEARTRWAETHNTVWTFWINWYENALEGRPQDWPLLREIALIPAEDWQGGPDRVHPIIEKMLIERERQKLLDQVVALSAELQEARRALGQPMASTAVRSHNQPPELVDLENEAQRAITIIWADLEEAKAELEKPEPEPSILKRIGQKLIGAVATFADYGATLGDIALRKGAEELGSTGTKAAIWVFLMLFAAQAGPVQSIGTGLLELAKMLGSP